MTDTPDQSTAHGISLDAIRPLTDLDAEQARRRIPVQLARIVAEVPRVRLGIDVVCAHDGAVSAAITVHGGPYAAQVAAEIAPLLEQIAETHQEQGPVDRDTNPELRRVFPVVSASGDAIGFTTVTAGARVCRWSARPDGLEHAARAAVLTELIAGCAEHGIGLELTPGSQIDTWSVRAWVSAPPTGPSLRLRAAIRQSWPGLHLADTAVPPEWVPALQVRTVDLPAIFAVPIAGAHPVAGMTVGAPAPIPVTPVRGDLSGGDEAGIRLGYARTITGHPVEVTLPAHERLRHVHVLGRTGTGKSSLLAAIAGGIAAAGEGLLLLDPHGSLVERVAHELPAQARTRTWIIDSGDVQSSVPINPLAVDDPLARDRAIDEVCAMFQYLFDRRESGVVGPRFRERVAMGLRTLIALRGPRASVLDVPTILANPMLMRRAAAESGDYRLVAWVRNDEKNRRSSEYGDLVSWVNSKFEAFCSTAALRGILGSGADAFDMAEAMDQRRIILVDLSKGPLGEPASRLLAFLHLNRTWQAALRRRTTSPFTVMVDEAHAVTAGALTAMLSEARKFGVSVVLAHQFLGQLDEDLLPAVDGNVSTTIGFRGAAADIPALAARFGGRVAPEVLMTLPDLSAVIGRTAAAGSRPHTLEVDHNTRTAAPTLQSTRWVERMRIATTAALATPHEEATAAARDGRCVLAPEPAEHQTNPEPEPRAGSYLDEWLAKRTRQATSGLPSRPRPDVSEPAPDSSPASGGADSSDAPV
ncbi:type IV secretory system conjugative DNA transfer family protein [Rhodococcus zopfii]